MEVKVAATGPATVRFVNYGDSKFKATITSAGSYVLAATFGGKLASGWNPLPIRILKWDHNLPGLDELLPVGNYF